MDMTLLISQDEKNKLREKVDTLFDQYIEEIYQKIPYAKHQMESNSIDMEYYKRHSIETPIRIKLKRTIDALVIHYFTKTNPKAAKDWANYTDDEMLHGHMFGKDIEKLWGITFDEVMNTEPLLATKLLNGYFYYHLEYEGPMAAIASAYFLEYATAKTQPVWLDNLERVLDKKNVAGARAHVTLDLEEDHDGFVWDVLMETVKTQKDVDTLMKHFKAIYGLFSAYLFEVYAITVGKNDSNAQKSPAQYAVETAVA